MEKEAEHLRANFDRIEHNTIEWQKANYPERTANYDKCRRDIRYVLKAYASDLRSDSVVSIQNVSAKYWFAGKRQINNYKAELAVHNFMLNFILDNVLSNEEARKKLIQCHEILNDTIIIGPKYQSHIYMNNYRYVWEYDEKVDVDEMNFEQALWDAWKNTPSKNNFMPYKVHVIKPDNDELKELIYYKCLENETKANGNHITDLEELKRYEKLEYDNNNAKPNYFNVKSAHYILIFTQRVETQPNEHQQDLIDRGFVYEQMAKDGPKKDSARSVAYLEIGMFCSNFANACLANGIDISHTLCFPSDKKYWSEPEFDFLDMHPLLIMTAGQGLKYRREHIPSYLDLKPNFERIVNIVDKK